MSKQGESAKAVRRGAGLPGVATEPDTQASGAKWTGKGREVREGPRGLCEQWRDFWLLLM